MIGPMGNSEICFLQTLMLQLKAKRNSVSQGETKLTVSHFISY